jgi:hypothetical protein
MSSESKWRVYGLVIESGLPFAAPLAAGKGKPDLLLLGGLVLSQEERLRFRHIYSSAFRDSQGKSLFELYQDGERELLSFTDRAEFLFDGGRILYRSLGRGDLLDVETLFLTSVLAYWLEQRGVLVLHASAVQVGENVAAFLASAGEGKSSLAAAFFDAGHRVVSDDILPITVGESGITVHSGYQEIKLNPDTGEHYLGERFHTLRRFAPEAEKRCLVVAREDSRDRRGSLSALYVIRRRREQREPCVVELQRLARRDAVIEVLRSTFTPTLVEGVGLAEGRLERMSQLVQRVPVFRVSYDSDLNRLPEAVAALVTSLGGIAERK